MTATVFIGDCLDVMRTMEPDSIDAIVTDPPAGVAFMGKDWDKDKGGRDEWVAWMTDIAAECFRLLKPGGHALVWALPRTSHWTGWAWESGGFVPRDVIVHIFGSGFPKSLNVGKAIDKAAGATREVVGVKSEKAHDIRNGHGRAYGGGMYAGEKPPPIALMETAPATDAAKQWDGWGTALKPAHEDWWLLRKPLIGTVAENVMRYGTGAINVDGGRVEGKLEGDPNRFAKTDGGSFNSFSDHPPAVRTEGRFPANLIHDGSEEATAPLGSAARFFYAAKASTRERNEGLDGRNIHSTVKPLALMRYLCRLITPPGGVILDPFCGSGSTGVAAIAEGFRFVGCELSEEYAAIAKARIEHAERQQEQRRLF